MRELVAHMCEQIARREDISVKSAKCKYKSLLESCHEKYAPIIKEWDLKLGAASIENEKVGTLNIEENGKVTARVACMKLTPTQNAIIAEIDAPPNGSKIAIKIRNVVHNDAPEQEPSVWPTIHSATEQAPTWANLCEPPKTANL